MVEGLLATSIIDALGLLLPSRLRHNFCLTYRLTQPAAPGLAPRTAVAYHGVSWMFIPLLLPLRVLLPCLTINQQERCLILWSFELLWHHYSIVLSDRYCTILVTTQHRAESGIWSIDNEGAVIEQTAQCHIGHKNLFQGGSKTDEIGVRASGSPITVMSSALSATTWMLQEAAAVPS